jgi:flagellar basal body-associated protein FliL
MSATLIVLFCLLMCPLMMAVMMMFMRKGHGESHRDEADRRAEPPRDERAG